MALEKNKGGAVLAGMHPGEADWRRRATRCTTNGSGGCSRARRTRSTVIKWKEIYDNLEKTLDTIEDASNVLESISIKHA